MKNSLMFDICTSNFY